MGRTTGTESTNPAGGGTGAEPRRPGVKNGGSVASAISGARVPAGTSGTVNAPAASVAAVRPPSVTATPSSRVSSPPSGTPLPFSS
jgi:hypothetical protein